MYLFLALIWLLLGLVLLLPELGLLGGRFKNDDWGQLVGWIALMFAAYNVVRWWSARSLAAGRRAAAELEHRRRTEEEKAPRAYQAPDPNFDFSDRGPPAPPPGQTKA
jgi:hypothetical protein